MNVTKKLAIIISALMIALSACGCSTSGDEYANEIYKSTDTTGSAPDTASPNAPETDAPGQDEADLTDSDKSESTAYDQDDTDLTDPDKSEPTAAAPDKSEPSKSASDKSEPSKSSPTTTAPDKRESEAPTQKNDHPASTNKPADSGAGTTETTAPDSAKPEGAPEGAQESAPETAPKTDGRGADTADEYEREVVRLVNEIRRARGLRELEYDEELTKVARLKSQDMNELGYFSHTSPTYGSPFDMMKSFGITYRAAGENIARGYRTPEAVIDGWMNSEGHRANILSDKFTRIGVGYVADGSYWTQMFRG